MTSINPPLRPTAGGVVLLALAVALIGVIIVMTLGGPATNDVPVPAGGAPIAPEPLPPPTPEPSQVLPSAQDQLLEHVPADVRGSCTGIDPASAGEVLAPGLVAGVTCAPETGPDGVDFYAYSSGPAMAGVFDALAEGLLEGDCSTGEQALDTWSLGDAVQGPLACYYAEDGQSIYLWGDDHTGVLAAAYDADMPLEDMYTWWSR